MALETVPAVLVFMALVLVVSLYGLAAAGHFPAEHRPPSLSIGTGSVILWGTMAVTSGLPLVAVARAWTRLPLAVAVIAGGGMLLASPLVLRQLPDRFVDGPAALLVFSGFGLALIALALLI